MKIYLKDSRLFEDEFIDFDKPINFIFGKNGTGKSRISRLIKDQIKDKDVRIYHGVESVAIDGKLNSVILGEENIEAQNNIKKLEEEIKEIIIQREKYNSQLEEIQAEIDSKDSDKKKKEKKIKEFYAQSAREIKNNKFHIAPTSYNSSMFEKEVKYANLLTEDEKNECQENTKLEEKFALKLPNIDLNFNGLLNETNNLLCQKVEEEKGIVRLSTDQKINFAKMGFTTHKKGDICSFCGNSISDKVFDELESFFSASKIKNLENSIKSLVEKIENIVKRINNISISIDNFYNMYHQDIYKLAQKWDALLKDQNKFLEDLKLSLENKLAQLFSKSDILLIDIPADGMDLISEYNTVVDRNNSEDFSRIKKFSCSLLRFDYIFTYISKFELNNKLCEFVDIDKECGKLIEKKEVIEGLDSELDLKINQKYLCIKEELSKTKSESKLADNINKKLDLYVAFQLEHIKENEDLNKGYYRIKNKELFDKEYRDIDTLSKGEKNIIGFLYFIEKLNEYKENSLDKIIIFDDPMDSNDDTMQYIIITEIQELMKSIDKNKASDILVIMTHNPHFYINVKYNRLYKDEQRDENKKKMADRFIRLQKVNSETKIKILESEGQDFKTSYELLWKELRFLYENDKPNLMLNSIRRIIETFTKFNRSNNFYGGNREAQKLFNVNSHSIDDFEADLNGKTREEIIDLMKACFISNNSEAHFDTHWKTARK